LRAAKKRRVSFVELVVAAARDFIDASLAGHDLSGEDLKNLKELGLWHSKVTDLSPLPA
jgi:hypothetical protein